MNFIIYILYRFLEIYEFIILLRCIFSFFASCYNGVYGFLCKITDPVLEPIRTFFWKIGLGGGVLDFSPVVAIVLVGVLQRCLLLISRMF